MQMSASTTSHFFSIGLHPDETIPMSFVCNQIIPARPAPGSAEYPRYSKPDNSRRTFPDEIPFVGKDGEVDK